MKPNIKSAKDFLLHDYSQRRQRNPRFSKRSYAFYLGLSNGRLTEILSGKSPITEKRAKAIVGKLNLDDGEKTLFLRFVENENQSRHDGRKRVSYSMAKRLQLDEFAVVSDWEYFALMALIETAVFRSDVDWISRKLGITQQRCQEVLNRLVELDYIQTNEVGSYKNNYKAMSTLTDIPSSVLRKANKECILQGIEAMESIDVQMREITSLTLPTDLGKLKAAKSLINKFKEEMSLLCETEQASEIYNLNIQFVPVSKLGV